MLNIQTRWLLPLSFFIFISYIIFLADTADYNFAFRVVRYIPYGDKIAHAFLYGMMALLLNYGLGFRKISVGCCVLTTPFYMGNKYYMLLKYNWCCKDTTPYKLSMQLGSVIVLTFAILEEFSQYYIPSRTFDLWDLGADFIGVVLFSFWRWK